MVNHEPNENVDALMAHQLQLVGADNFDGALTQIIAQQQQQQQQHIPATGYPGQNDTLANVLMFDKSTSVGASNTTNDDMEMMGSETGRAWKLVEQLITFHIDLLRDYDHLYDVSLLARDDVVSFAERLLNCQAHFREAGKPHKVTVGYHYTDSKKIPLIRQASLLSRPERNQQKVGAPTGGTLFGDGIYLANNPIAFSHFGDVGLMVAILKGKASGLENSEEIDTVVGNRMPTSCHQSNEGIQFWEETVLKKTDQCIPLLTFTKPPVASEDWAFLESLWHAHCRLQKSLDNFFNDGIETTNIRVSPPAVYFDRISAQGILHRQHKVWHARPQSVAIPASQRLPLPPRPPRSIADFLAQTKPSLRTKLRETALSRLLQQDTPWTKEETRLFLQGVKQEGCNWEKIAELLPSRSVDEVRSYANRYYPNLVRKADRLKVEY